MKKHVTILALLIIGLIYPFSDTMAHYPIPATKVTLEQVFNTLEEDIANNIYSNSLISEERQMIIKVVDELPGQLSWAVVVIYSTDGQDELGPYTVYEGTPLQMDIDEREWEVNVTDFLEGCTVSSWIEE